MSEDPKMFVRENEGKPQVCTFNEKRELTPCWPMEEALEPSYGRGTKYQGMKINSMVNMSTHKFSRHQVALKSGALSKKGVEISFCPFCRAPMSEDVEEVVKEAEVAA